MRYKVTSFILFLALSSVAGTTNARAQQLLWAKHLESAGGGAASATAYDVAIDASGNVYAVGTFNGAVDFDPGPGAFVLTSVSAFQDVWVWKLDPNGNFIWAKDVGGADSKFAASGAGSSFEGVSIALDSNGNAHVGGGFINTVDFDPGPGTFNLSATTGNGGQWTDAFVLKLDTNGNFVWAKQFAVGPHVNNNDVRGIAVDSTGNVYSVGEFENTGIDFDPGPGVFYLDSYSGITTFQDAFICKFTAFGFFVWAKHIGGGHDDRATSVALDASRNIYIGGDFRTLEGAPAEFDPNGDGTVFLMQSAGGYDAFVDKLDSNGNFLWAGQMGGTSDDHLVDIALSSTREIYSVGSFRGTADFDPGLGEHDLVATGFSDGFISKLDTNGTFVWAYGRDPVLSGVAVTPGASVYAVGDSPPNAVKVDANGRFVWEGQLGSRSTKISADSGGNVVTVGGGGLTKFAPIGSGAVPDGNLPPGVPLKMSKPGGTSLGLTWGPSCLGGDLDYEIYEGVLGNFTSHLPTLCSTGGATTASIVPSSGDTYYLVVPSAVGLEGSYGKDSANHERLPSASSCVAQSVVSCP